MKRKYLILPLVCLLVGAWYLLSGNRTHHEKSFKNSSSQEAVISSSIRSIHSFEDIRAELENAESNTLIIFDIDDVLITYNDMVLRPCGAQFEPTCLKGIDPKEIPLLESIMFNEGKIILVEPSTPHLIDRLEKNRVKTIALTSARTGKFGVIENVEDWRLRILKQFNIDFSQSFPESQIIYFEKGAKKESDYALFKQGIVFLGDERNTKGFFLLKFLESIQWTPKKILFIDDKMSNLTSVATALEGTNIAFQGYQYHGVDYLPGEFNEQVAEVQFAHLRKEHKWLSDAEAKEELERSLGLLPVETAD
jgi:hypothetical protein